MTAFPPSVSGVRHEIRADVPVGLSMDSSRGADGTLSGMTSAVALFSSDSADAVLVMVTIFVSYRRDGSSCVN